MSAAAIVALTTAVLEDANLVAALILEELRGDLGAGDERGANLGSRALPEEDHLVKGDRVPLLGLRQEVDGEDIALLNSKLATGGEDRGLHGRRKVEQRGRGVVGKGFFSWIWPFRIGHREAP